MVKLGHRVRSLFAVSSSILLLHHHYYRNPANCEVWEMRKDMANHGRYRMVTPVRGWDEKGQNPMTMLSELFEHDHKHAMTSERLFETEWQRVKYRVRRFIRSWGRK